jgi:hypothetical protein
MNPDVFLKYDYKTRSLVNKLKFEEKKKTDGLENALFSNKDQSTETSLVFTNSLVSKESGDGNISNFSSNTDLISSLNMHKAILTRFKPDKFLKMKTCIFCVEKNLQDLERLTYLAVFNYKG